MRYCVITALTLYVGLGIGARYGVIMSDLSFPICVEMIVSYLANDISRSS